MSQTCIAARDARPLGTDHSGLLRCERANMPIVKSIMLTVCIGPVGGEKHSVLQGTLDRVVDLAYVLPNLSHVLGTAQTNEL